MVMLCGLSLSNGEWQSEARLELARVPTYISHAPRDQDMCD